MSWTKGLSGGVTDWRIHDVRNTHVSSTISSGLDANHGLWVQDVPDLATIEVLLRAKGNSRHRQTKIPDRRSMRNWIKSLRRSRQVSQTKNVDPKDMIGTDKSVVYFLQRSDNDDYFALSGLTGRYPRKAGMPWTPPRLPSDDCPPGVYRMAMEPILNWTEHIDEIVIKFKKGVPHQLPDRLRFQSYTIVSARCRELFERIDPDGGHVYIPASLLTADKRPVGGEWFYMWCGRTFHSDKVKHSAGIVEDNMTHGIHYERHMATPERCKFFKETPMWTVIGEPGPRYMSQGTFAQVKESGLTGFREFTMPSVLYYPDEDEDLPSLITPPNVSHIWF